MTDSDGDATAGQSTPAGPDTDLLESPYTRPRVPLLVTCLALLVLAATGGTVLALSAHRSAAGSTATDRHAVSAAAAPATGGRLVHFVTLDGANWTAEWPASSAVDPYARNRPYEQQRLAWPRGPLLTIDSGDILTDGTHTALAAAQQDRQVERESRSRVSALVADPLHQTAHWIEYPTTFHGIDYAEEHVVMLAGQHPVNLHYLGEAHQFDQATATEILLTIASSIEPA